jgi:hypothetical protein
VSLLRFDQNPSSSCGLRGLEEGNHEIGVMTQLQPAWLVDASIGLARRGSARGYANRFRAPLSSSAVAAASPPIS